MSKYRKITSEAKFEIVKEYLSGNSSFKDIGKSLGYVSKKRMFLYSGAEDNSEKNKKNTKV